MSVIKQRACLRAADWAIPTPMPVPTLAPIPHTHTAADTDCHTDSRAAFAVAVARRRVIHTQTFSTIGPKSKSNHFVRQVANWVTKSWLTVLYEESHGKRSPSLKGGKHTAVILLNKIVACHSEEIKFKWWNKNNDKSVQMNCKKTKTKQKLILKKFKDVLKTTTLKAYALWFFFLWTTNGLLTKVSYIMQQIGFKANSSRNHF